MEMRVRFCSCHLKIKSISLNYHAMSFYHIFSGIFTACHSCEWHDSSKDLGPSKWNTLINTVNTAIPSWLQQVPQAPLLYFCVPEFPATFFSVVNLLECMSWEVVGSRPMLSLEDSSLDLTGFCCFLTELCSCCKLIYKRKPPFVKLDKTHSQFE